MRILWHGIGPWHKTGYGTQTALFAPRLKHLLGHEVAVAVMGRQGKDTAQGRAELTASEALGVTWAHPDARPLLATPEWQGIPVIGPGETEFGLPRPAEIRAAFGGHNPDLIIVCKDAWVLKPDAYRGYNVAVWCNIDTDPMGVPDRRWFEASGAVPVAVAKHGVSVMRKAGLKPVYVPHGIGPEWVPGNQTAARDLLGLPQGAFLAGINAANIGPRKGWGEQLGAFASFHMKLQPNSFLLIHAVPEHPEGINLRHLAAFHGIEDAVLFGSHTNMRGPQMLSWYQSLDVLLACSYGEGFGLPIVEALACGVPVIGTECTAITEKIPAGAGWLVHAQEWWNPHHQANWHIPRTGQITAKLAHAHTRAIKPLPAHSAHYGADFVTMEHWKPALEELC